jgi:hypothetical protein
MGWCLYVQSLHPCLVMSSLVSLRGESPNLTDSTRRYSVQLNTANCSQENTLYPSESFRSSTAQGLSMRSLLTYMTVFVLSLENMWMLFFRLGL